jgi:hypothetical protein
MSKLNLTEEELVQQGVDISIASFKLAKPHKPAKPVMIYFNGNALKTLSGKSLWKNAGHAKLAILNHIESSLAENNRIIYRNRELCKRVEQKVLEKIQIVPV